MPITPDEFEMWKEKHMNKQLRPSPLVSIDTCNHHTALVTFHDFEACARCARAGLVSKPVDGVFSIRDEKPYSDNIILNTQYRRWIEAGGKVERVGR